MRVSVFVDGSNVYFMQKKALGWNINLEFLLKYLENKYGEIVDAFYYVGQDTPPGAQQQSFLDLLPTWGYSLVSKQVKTIHDSATGEVKKKANLDIEIVLDMFNTIDNYDHAILVSGDGDFERPLSLLKARGKSFDVLSTDGFVARELRYVAGRHYTDVQNIRTEIERL